MKSTAQANSKLTAATTASPTETKQFPANVFTTPEVSESDAAIGHSDPHADVYPDNGLNADDADDDGPDNVVDVVDEDDNGESFLGFNATGPGAGSGELTFGAKMALGRSTLSTWVVTGVAGLSVDRNRKSAVGRGQDGDAVGGVGVAFDLSDDVGASQEADEEVESAGFPMDFGDVGGLGATPLGRRGLNKRHGRWRLSRGYCLRGVFVSWGLCRRLSKNCGEEVDNEDD
ncbi:hypothetical protein TIFTF001_000657 [Ficus carica]|uniref:Uncharacterized protein n=1 Tax=Ficus carica TaxID=3494 RepID=A0AA87YWJ6_FICCA|nr:hypothetical protein TIFTF001_000657 [Ficus carica]